MECPNCTFQNIPGTRACVRCATLLDFSGVEVDPPRASSGRLGRQARAAAISARATVRGGTSEIARTLRLPQLGEMGLFGYLRTLVPGLPQIWSDVRALRVLGWIILAVWSLVLLLALFSVGTDFAMLLCFAAISIHCFSASLALARDMEDAPLIVRLVLGLSLYFFLMLVVYTPGYVLAQQLAVTVPIAGIRNNVVVANGETLVRTAAWTRPARFERGDLVVCTIDPAYAGGHGQGIMVLGGYNVDRIIGLPGDHVVVEKGVLTVNGVTPPPDMRPIGGTEGLPDCQFVVEDNSLAIFPSVFQMNALFNNRLDLFLQIAVRPRNEVLGRVIFRLRPWSRMGVLGGAVE